MRRTAIYSVALGVIAQILYTDTAFAQYTVYNEGPGQLTSIPTDFGPAGTKVRVMQIMTPLDTPDRGDVHYENQHFATDDKSTFISGCGYAPNPGDAICECIYDVTPADVSRGEINFEAIEVGFYMVTSGNGTKIDDYTHSGTTTHSLNYNASQTGWTGGGNSCSVQGWTFTDGSGGYTQGNPLLPFISNGVFTFDLPLAEAPTGTFWIDPPVASGFDYAITGAEFVSTTLPSQSTVPDPDGYTLSYGSQTVLLQPDETHTFASPVSSFSVSGINPDLMLDPGDEIAFPIGIDITTPTTDVQITQTPQTVNYTPVNTPPIANAGPDATGQAPHNFTLDGSASSDPDGDALTYHWRQLSGPNLPLKNEQTATPTTYGFNFLTPTTVVMELKVEDSNGVMSAPDQVELTMLPPPNMNQCTPWNRDKLIDSLNFYPEGNGYSITQTISGQTQSDLQSWVNNIPSQYPDFEKFEIKSYLSAVGTGETPQLHGSAVPNIPRSSRYFTAPASPAPAPYWTGGHFQADAWYRLATKINVYRANGYFHDEISRSAPYDDKCVYQTVYFKIDAQSGKLQTAIGEMKDPKSPLINRPVVGRPVIGRPAGPMIGRPVISGPMIADPVISNPIIGRPVISPAKRVPLNPRKAPNRNPTKTPIKKSSDQL